MSQPLISIVMPAYQCGQTLAASVQSVLQQSYDHWELVISIDDDEDYAGLLEQQGLLDPRLKLVRTGAVGTGSSHARNVGVAAASSDFIAVLDADDLFTPDKLMRVAPLLADHPLISTGLQITDAALQPLRQVGCTGDPRLLDARTYKFTNISMDSMIVYDRRRLPIHYDESQPCLVDMDLIFKAFCHTPTCLHIGAPLHLYRKQAVSISNGPDAGSKFTQMKRILISRIESKYYEFTQPDLARQGFLAFLQASLDTEIQFSKQAEPHFDQMFENLLESNLSR